MIVYWTPPEIGRNNGVEVMTLVGRASGICLEFELSGLSSCVHIKTIPGLRISTIIWYLFCAIQLVFDSTLAIMLDITAADDSEIPMGMLSHLGGGGGSI